jgi:hypothetical protein
MDSAKTEAYEREMKGKKIKLASNRTSYMRYQEGREHRDASNGRMKYFFPPPQSSTRQSKGSGVADACCAGVNSFLFFFVKRKHHPLDQTTIAKKTIMK